MLEATNIKKSYKSVEVLKNINLKVEPAEIVTIVGASGAGKSTLLHILGTLDKPDQGNVSIEGKSIFDQSDKELAATRNKHFGFVFQFHNLLPEFSALENVQLPALIKGVSKKESQELAKKYLDVLGLSHRLDHKPSMLSGGEQQRVSVARALVNSPDIILADEPTGNLDSANAKEMHELFFKLRDTYGQAFIIVTHNQELAEMADRKLTIIDGHIY